MTEPNMTDSFNTSLDAARELDANDPLKSFRQEFHIPRLADGNDEIYFVGNSLGLQPRRTAGFLEHELEQWRRLGVRGHFEGPFPWMPYHEFLTEPMAKIVGAGPEEVVMMNGLTANLHLMMASFYRPTGKRHKILIEHHAFPSDHYATESQIRWHGHDPQASLVELAPASGRETITTEQVIDSIREHRDSLALVLLPGVQYYSGQVFDMRAIAAVANEFEIPIGFDLAHAAGNIAMNLSDWNVDFAVWCSYKYLNSGPGSVAGCFVHRRHATNVDHPRLAGWWGHDKATRFQMQNEFQAIPTAEGWQLSNPPILSLAAIRASLEVFMEAGGMQPLRQKSELLTGFFIDCVQSKLEGRVEIITPTDVASRGCQLSLKVTSPSAPGREVHDRLESIGIRTDWREPNGIRAAPVPLYNTFEEVWHFVEALKECL